MCGVYLYYMCAVLPVYGSHVRKRVSHILAYMSYVLLTKMKLYMWCTYTSVWCVPPVLANRLGAEGGFVLYVMYIRVYVTHTTLYMCHDSPLYV
jgi:hypothetical protein